MEIIEFVNDDDIVVVITDEGQFDVDRGKFDRWKRPNNGFLVLYNRYHKWSAGNCRKL